MVKNSLAARCLELGCGDYDWADEQFRAPSKFHAALAFAKRRALVHNS